MATRPCPRVGVIVSCYNSPEFLRKTLLAYTRQTRRDFTLIVADDGSDDRTRALLDRFRQDHFPGLLHVWHPDTGFEKCKILNAALLKTDCEYLIFTDQDCLPREDFVAQHMAYAEPGRYLSGRAICLPQALTNRIDDALILSGQIFDRRWLEANGLRLGWRHAMTRLTRSARLAKVSNALSPGHLDWAGGNASGWRTDLIAVGGFDERMKYGAEDTEFGERLRNAGILPKQIRYGVVCLHLEHARPYKSDEMVQRNLAMLQDTVATGRTRTAFGIDPASRAAPTGLTATAGEAKSLPAGGDEARGSNPS